MAQIEINKVETIVSSTGLGSDRKETKAKIEVEQILILNGILHFVPKSRKYQHLHLTSNNCIIIK